MSANVLTVFVPGVLIVGSPKGLVPTSVKLGDAVVPTFR